MGQHNPKPYISISYIRVRGFKFAMDGYTREQETQRTGNPLSNLEPQLPYT